ncbi:MAG: hypothetical protein IPH60_17090 [Flavobacteriales bacterium]|nr:hypothetical protein [Flavobacteriales bacterium]
MNIGSSSNLFSYYTVVVVDDGVERDTVEYFRSGFNIPPFGDHLASFDVDLEGGHVYSIKTWTRNPSGLPDVNPANDTLELHTLFVDPSVPHLAIDFSPIGSYVDIPDASSLDMATDFTIECWIKPVILDGATIWNKSRCQSGEMGYSLSLTNGRLVYTWIRPGVPNCGGSNPSVVQSADPVVQQDTWQHIALVHRTDTILIYLNGERVISTLVQNSFGNVQTNAQSLLIGAYRNQAGVISTTSFGQLDELRIWNEARSSEEIRSDMVQIDDLQIQSTLVSVWHFGEGTGPVAGDSKGSNHGALVNGAAFSTTAAPILDASSAASLDVAPVGVSPIVRDTILPEGSYVLDVLVQNNSSVPLTSLDLEYAFDGELNTVPWAGSILVGQTGVIPTGMSIDLNSGVLHRLMVRTNQPNGAQDGMSTNDTLNIDPFFADPAETHQAIALGTPSGINAGGSITVEVLPGLPTGSNTRTIEFWVKPGNQTDFLIGYGGNQTTSDRFYVSRLVTGEVSVYYGNNASYQLISTEVIPQGQWSHVAITYESPVLTIYINGRAAGQQTASLATQNSIFCIGRTPTATIPGQWYDGSMDEVRVWSEARTPELIREWMVKSAGIELQFGLVAAWSFTEPDGSSSTFDRIANIEGILDGTYSFTANAAPVSDNAIQTDLAVIALLSPLSGCNHDGTEPVVATVRNFGTAPVTSFVLGFIQNDTLIHTEQVDTVIAPSASLDLTLGQLVDLRPNSTNTLAITVSIAGDQNQQNDTLIAVIQSYPPILVSLEDDFSICQGDSVTLHAAGGSSYLWNDGASGPNKIIAPNVTSEYTVSVTGANGCLDSASVTVTVLPLPSQPIITPSATALCPGSSATLTSTVSSNLIWNTGATDVQILANSPGAYSVAHVDPISGCSNLSEPFVLQAAQVLQIQAEGPLTLCQGDVLTLTALNSGGAITWTGGASATSIVHIGNLLGPDTIALSGTSIDGCSDPDSVVVLVIPSGPPDQVTDMLPFDQAIFVPSPTTLSFQPVPNTSNYDIFLWLNDQTQPTDPYVANTTLTNHTIAGLQPDTTYAWFVRARNSCDTSYSSTRTFRTTGTIDFVIDTLIIPSTIVAGTDVPVSFVCRNQGNGPTGLATWRVRFYLSTDNDLRIGDDILLLNIPNLTYLNAGQSYSQTVTVHIPQTVSGSYFFYVIADNNDAYCWNASQCANGPYGAHDHGLAESNEDNNFQHAVVLVSVPPAPDLVCSLVGSASGPFNSNALLPVSCGIKNDGATPVFNSTVTNIIHVTLADQYQDPANLLPSTPNPSGGDLSYPSGAARYFTVNIGTLLPGQDTIVQVNVQLQPQMVGDYHVYATIDAGDDVFEAAAEGNNYSERDGTIEVVSAVADLVPAPLTLPSTHPTHSTLVIPYQYQNLVTLTPVVNNYANKAFLSSNALFDPQNATLIGTRQRADGQSLTQGLVVSDQFTYQVPVDSIGSYFIHVWVDANDVIYEPDLDYLDNVVSAPITFFLQDTIDLVVSNLTAPATALSGQSISVTVAYGNIGPDALNQATTLGIYRSTYGTFHPDSVVLVSSVAMPAPAFPAGSNVNTTIQTTIPNGFSGPLFYYAFVDRQDLVFELNEANIGNAVVNVSLAPYPDLRVTVVNAPAITTPRLDLPISYTVQNAGNTPLVASNRVDRYVLSFDLNLGNSDDIDLGTRPFNSVDIPAGGSVICNVLLDIAYNFPYGPRYLFVIADQGNSIFEFFGGAPAENNNASTPVVVTVTPAYTDVAAEDLVAPAIALSGSTISASFKEHNLGPNTADRNIRSGRVYLSPDGGLTGAYTINSMDLVNVLDSGEVVQKNFTFQVPNGIQGDWYVIGKTDFNDLCGNDSVPANNTISTPIHIDLSDPIDLYISNVTPLPGTIYSGQCLSVGITVRNDSIGSTTQNWTDRALINTAPSTFGATALVAASHIGGIGASGGQYTSILDFCLPGAMSGSRYLILETDRWNSVYEHQAEDNNQVIIPIFLNVPAPTDLEVTMVDGPSSWFLGFENTVTLNVRNNGPGVAVGLLGNNVHFSLNQLLEPLIDPLLGSKSQGILLQSGESVDIALTKLLSGIDIGPYYLVAGTNTAVSIPELNYANNTNASLAQTTVDATEIPLNDTAYAALNSGDLLYYKVQVDEPGLDVLVSLLTDQPFGDKRLYVSLGHVPTEADHDFEQIDAPNGVKQVLIPSAATGTYFILATTQVSSPNDQAASVAVVGLPFSIIAVVPGTVGQGPVTTTVIGAGFNSAMSFELLDQGNNVVSSASVTGFVNSMQVEVGWDLSDVDTGAYLVRTMNLSMEQATYSPFIVAEGDDYVLRVSDLSAEVLKSSGTSYLTYTVSNDGLVDIPIITLELALDSGLVVHGVITSANIIRSESIDELNADSVNYSIATDEGRTTISVLASGVHPQEELMLSVAISGQRSPSITPALTALPKSYDQFILEGLFQLSVLRQSFLSGEVDQSTLPDDLVSQLSDPDVLVENNIQFLLSNGIVDPAWHSSYVAGCPSCLAMPLNPGLPVGTEHYDALTLGPARMYIWHINDLDGGAGLDPGWDLVDVEGQVTVTATAEQPMVLNIGPLNSYGLPYPLADFDPCRPYSWPIMHAAGFIGFDTTKVFINDDYFKVLCNTVDGHFRLYIMGGTEMILSYVPGCLSSDCMSDADTDGVMDCYDRCPNDPFKADPGHCGCGVADVDSDGDGAFDCEEGCDLDPNKQFPGLCGCGIADVNSDGDAWVDCLDLCPLDPNKRFPGSCGCGVPDTDTDGDGFPDCVDLCPNDPNEIAPGVCGCGAASGDDDGDGTINCFDACPSDPLKIVPGTCGCGVLETDSDSDGTPNCIDLCPGDPLKTQPGSCGCGTPDTDTDNDGVADCLDGCPFDSGKTSAGICGCGVADLDNDNDYFPNCIDGCPDDPYKVEPGTCGCGVSDGDADGDGHPNCEDFCPLNPEKWLDGGVCGCDYFDNDADGDGCPNCVDACPNDPLKCEPGACGCGFEERSPCVECKSLTSHQCSNMLDAAGCGLSIFSCGRDLVALGFSSTTVIGVAWFGYSAYSSCTGARDNCNNGLTCDAINKFVSDSYLESVIGDNVEKYQLDPRTFRSFVRKPKISDFMGVGAITYTLCQLKTHLCKRIASPCDPNEILGPVGVGTSAWIATDIQHAFQISFENDSLIATGSAQVVGVALQLEEDFAVYSFRLGDFAIGDTTFHIPTGQMYYSTQFMHNGVLVQLNAGVNVNTRKAYWSFESLDPQTLLPPYSPLVGFLPPNDVSGRGQGVVSFSIAPSSTAVTRDTLSAQAEITFDINEPILTNTWVNLVDAEGPNSQVDSLVSVNQNSLLVHYTSLDPNQGSGVEHVDLYASTDGAPASLVASGLPPNGSYSFNGTTGLSYCFYTVAHDSVLYAEALPPQPDACTTLLPQVFALVGPAAGSSWCIGGSVNIVWGTGTIESFDIEISDNGGGSFTSIAIGVIGPNYMWSIPAGTSPGNQYIVRISDSGDPATYVESGLFTIQALPATPSVTANGPVEFCAGGQVQLSGPAGFSSYHWLPSGSNDPSTTVTTNGNYSLSVTDSNGCTSEPSIGIIVVVHALPAAPSISPSPAEFCEGDSLLLMAASGYDQYSWSTGASTQSIWVDATTSVQLTGTDAFGCVSPSNSVYVVEWPLPGTPQIVVQGGDTLCSDIVAQSYLWTYEGNPIGTEQCQPMTWAGVYRLYVSNGPCQDSAIFIITDVNSLQSPSSEIMVIPNPNQGSFDLLLSEAFDQEVSLQITSSSGQVVHRQLVRQAIGTTRRIPIDLRNAADGVYDMLLTGENSSRLIRVAVRK